MRQTPIFTLNVHNSVTLSFCAIISSYEHLSLRPAAPLPHRPIATSKPRWAGTDKPPSEKQRKSARPGAGGCLLRVSSCRGTPTRRLAHGSTRAETSGSRASRRLAAVILCLPEPRNRWACENFRLVTVPVKRGDAGLGAYLAAVHLHGCVHGESCRPSRVSVDGMTACRLSPTRTAACEYAIDPGVSRFRMVAPLAGAFAAPIRWRRWWRARCPRRA